LEASLSDALCYLLAGKGNNFYARILSALQVRETKDVPAMAVMLEERHFVLLYNDAWVDKSSFEEVVATIEHEALHLVLEHIPRKLNQAAMHQSDENKEKFFRCTPFAEDMADNCMLSKSNEWVEKPENATNWVWPDVEPFNYPRDKTYEYYLNRLMDEEDENENLKQFMIANGPGTGKFMLMDNHGLWEKAMEGLSDEEKQGLVGELEGKTKDIVRKAKDDHARSRGTLPSFLEELINGILEPPRIPWTQLLRDKIVNARRSKPRRSIARPNRRHIGIPQLCAFPGRVRDPAFTVAFCIDTSGSMGTRELEIALSELQHLQNTDSDIEIFVIECDAKIGKEYKITSTSKIDYQLSGRGGTTFDPALIRANELKPDICFYYTDGYAPAPQPHNRVHCPMVWLISPGGQICDHNWGFSLEMRDR